MDLSSGIAGAYCGKLVADAGAEVVKLEPPEGDPLRRWSIGRPLGPGEDGALFQFLACGKKSVVVDPPGREFAEPLIRAAAAVVWSPGTSLAEHAALSPETIRRLAPHAVVVSITPFGLAGPWANRPWTEFTLQAWSGGIWHRGEPDRPPVHIAGRAGEWAAGAIAAVALLVSRQRALGTGAGELVDVSILESLALTHTGIYPVTYFSVAGRPFQPYRRLNLPDIEPTKDGFVGFMVVTAQQWHDFCVLVDHPEWIDDPSLATLGDRAARGEEIRRAIRQCTMTHTTEEIMEKAIALRVPATPIGDGATVAAFDHFVARRAFARNPRGGDLQPEPAFLLHGESQRREPDPPPRLGEHTAELRGSAEAPRRSQPARSAGDSLPLEGIRVADFTMFWAGPIVGSILGMMGADVIHVESAQRPDGIRFMSTKRPNEDRWWEWAPLFLAGNTNKRGITLDFQKPRGRELALRLVEHCDVVLENFSPRVMDSLGMGYEPLKAVRPDLIMVRMSAFGLDGPWRDRTGYAQTQEQVSGMASITGWPDRGPMTPSGPCDPLAGIHATVATLLALEHRRRTGEGMLVDVPMVGGALNVAAEIVIEHSAYGNLLRRMGNRGPAAAPQNLYLTADLDHEGRRDCWVAIAVESNEQWVALRSALGDPAWARDSLLDSVGGRRAKHDTLDEHLGAWCAARSADEIVDTLWHAGVPVGRVVPAFSIDGNPQMDSRGYFETLDHPVVGPARYQGFPARFSSGPKKLQRRPSPTLGRDNEEVLSTVLGLSPREIAELRAQRIIGEKLVPEP